MEFEGFQADFEEKEQELFVLIREVAGCSKKDGYWVATAYFLSYVDAETGTLYQKEGRLVWPISEKDRETSLYTKAFRNETIYRVKGRALIKENMPQDRQESFYNQFYVTKVLGENVQCQELEEILTEYQKPVSVSDPILGVLKLDKRFGTFDGTLVWMGEPISISLDVEKKDEATWAEAQNRMRKLISAQENWDKDIREFAAEQLTSLANDWQVDEDEDKPELTKEDFAKRIKLSLLAVSYDGTFTVYFNDDDMFWGHTVTVYGDIEKGFETAEIQG